MNVDLSSPIYVISNIYSFCIKNNLPSPWGTVWFSDTGNIFSQLSTDKNIIFWPFNLVGRGIRWLNFQENILPKSVWMASFATKIQYYSETVCAF